MTRWDRYLAGNVWAVFWRTLLVLITLFVVIDLLTHRRGTIAEKEIPWPDVARYYALLIPTLLTRYQATALAAFVAAVLVSIRMARRQESLALLSCGIPMFRIVLAPLGFGCVVGIAVFAMSQTLAPWAAAETETFEVNRFGDRAPWNPRERGPVTWAKLGDGWLCHVSLFNRIAMAGEDVFLTRVQPDDVQVLRARRIYWEPETQTWWLEQGTSYRYFPKEAMESEHTRFGLIEAPISEAPSNLFAEDVRPETMRADEVRRLAIELEAKERPSQRLWVYFHTQFSQPWLAVISMALGIPFALRYQRGGGIARNLALGVVCALAYLTCFAVTQGMGSSGTLSPVLAAWLAHAVFGVLAVILCRNVST